MFRRIEPSHARDSRQQPPESGLLLRLGIRSSLLLSFGGMSVIMVLAVLGSLYFSTRVNNAVQDILESQLPITVDTFRLARAADTLAASGLTLATLSVRADRDAAFQRLKNAEESLEAAFLKLKEVAGDVEMIPSSLFAELKDNLHRLQAIVDDRIILREQQAEAKKRLLAYLLTFQQELTYRARILEGDGDVIKRLMERADPPVEQVAAMARQLANLLPVARFYATVEFINGRLLLASQSPTRRDLNTLRQELDAAMETIRDILKVLPEDLGRDLAQPVLELAGLIRDEDGLVQLRERELLLLEEIHALNAINKSILQRVNTATNQMVGRSQEEVYRTSATLMDMRERSMLILVFLSGLGVLGVVGCMFFYVNRHVITRLSWLSAAMQHVAAGRLDISLPPAGKDELGCLGAALQQFRATASEAREREAALQASSLLAKRAMEELEAKTAELERANRKLTELSIRDSLTGLFNRRHFDEVLALEWARAGHGGKAVALLILDVDFFKDFNDRYGHQAGDECLRSLAAVFMNHARRAGDVAARYGGEEFCMICPYTDMDKAKMLAQSIHKTVLGLELPHEGSPLGVVTVSIGYASAVPDGKCTATELLHAADGALYEAKSDGRNCVRGAVRLCDGSPGEDTPMAGA